MHAKRNVPISRWVVQALFTVVLFCNLYPLFWMIVNSVKTDRELYQNPFGFASEPQWSNYAKAWDIGNIGPYFFNSVFVGAVAVFLTLALATWASFFISRFQFRGKPFVLMLFVLGMLIPIHATLVPLFVQMNEMNLLNTRFTLVFPYAAFNLPIAVLLLVSFMNSFPRDLEEAAIMDGAGVMDIFAKVTLPMLRPILVTVLVISFLDNWNEFSFALVLISDSDLKTLPLGLAGFADRHTQNYTLQMAGITIVLIPTILFFLSLQKQITEGMTAGAVKG